MKRFRFSLETVLKVKRQVEELRQRELAAAQAEKDRERMRLGGLEQDLLSLLDDHSERRSGRLDLNGELWFGSHQMGLDQAIKGARRELVRLEGLLDQARQRVVEAARDRRVLEKLEENQRLAHLEKVNREEQGLLDELAQRAISSLGLPSNPVSADEAVTAS